MPNEPPPPLTDEEADRAKHRAVYALGRFGADGTDIVYRWALQLERERDELRAVVREYGSCRNCSGQGEYQVTKRDPNGIEEPRVVTRGCSWCDGSGLDKRARDALTKAGGQDG